MAFTNPETNLETLKVETPEELILKLKDKSKNTLANRVEGIVESINWTTQDKWAALKKDLTQFEELDIRKAIDTDWETNVWDVLDEGLSETEKQEFIQVKELDEVIWKWNWKIITKWLWYMEKLEKSFSEAWKLFNEGKYVAAFMAFFSGLFWKWKPKTEKQEWEEIKENETNEKKNINDTFYTTTNIFVWLAKEGKNKELNDIIFDNSFNTLKYKDVQDLSKLNKEQLKEKLKKLKILKSHKNIDEVHETIKILTSWNWKKIIDDIYKNQNIENKSIKEIITNLSSELIIIKDITNVDIVSLQNIPSALDISINKEWNVGWALEWKLKNLWLTKNIILTSLTWNYEFDDIDTLKEKILESSKYNDLNDTEKEKLEEMIEFWFKMQEILKTNQNLNLWNINLNNELSNKPLTIKDILQLYAVTWWNSDFDQLNWFQKTYVYFSIANILDNRWSNEQEWSYKMAITKEILNVWSDKASNLPDDVKDTLNTIWISIKNKAISMTKEFSAEIIWAIKENPALWIAALLLLVIYPFKKTESIIEKFIK